jgi:hypothetical protein
MIPALVCWYPVSTRSLVGNSKTLSTSLPENHEIALLEASVWSNPDQMKRWPGNKAPVSSYQEDRFLLTFIILESVDGYSQRSRLCSHIGDPFDTR